MSFTVKVPANKGPEITIRQSHGEPLVFAVGSDDTVQCESQADADLLIRIVDGSSLVEPDKSAASSSGTNTPKEK